MEIFNKFARNLSKTDGFKQNKIVVAKYPFIFLVS